MITMNPPLSPTDVRYCEACWQRTVGAASVTPHRRTLLCTSCAASGYLIPRTELFPPLGIRGLTERKIRHG